MLSTYIAFSRPLTDVALRFSANSRLELSSEGAVKIISVAKKGEVVTAAGDGLWNISQHKILPSEANTSLDIQFIKKKTVNNNNMVVYITDQYGELLPFYASPIGGVPKFKSKIVVKEK